MVKELRDRDRGGHDGLQEGGSSKRRGELDRAIEIMRPVRPGESGPEGPAESRPKGVVAVTVDGAGTAGGHGPK